MAEGTIAVLAAIAKKADTIFSAADIFDETKLDRALVYYHLGQFTKKGYIDKQGSKYIVVDRDSLIEAIAFGAKDQAKVRADATLIFTHNNVKTLNETIDLIIQAKFAGVPCSHELKLAVNKAIVDTLDSLGNARRGVNGGKKSQKKAKKLINDNPNWLQEYVARLDYFGIPYDKEILTAYVENL